MAAAGRPGTRCPGHARGARGVRRRPAAIRWRRALAGDRPVVGAAGLDGDPDSALDGVDLLGEGEPVPRPGFLRGAAPRSGTPGRAGSPAGPRRGPAAREQLPLRVGREPKASSSPRPSTSGGPQGSNSRRAQPHLEGQRPALAAAALTPAQKLSSGARARRRVPPPRVGRRDGCRGSASAGRPPAPPARPLRAPAMDDPPVDVHLQEPVLPVGEARAYALFPRRPPTLPGTPQRLGRTWDWSYRGRRELDRAHLVFGQRPPARRRQGALCTGRGEAAARRAGETLALGLPPAPNPRSP